MKYAIALIALLLVSASAVTHKLSNAQVQKIEDLKKGHTWGGIMLNLAELHMLAQGPLDELISAIEEVVVDLNKKLDRANKEFDARTARHVAEVTRLNGEIDSAKSDIANTESFLNDVLYVQKATLEADIVNLQTNIANTHQYIEEITATRQREHEEFLVKVDEAKAAIAAIDECLELLATLDGAASLAQVKKAKTALQKVQAKLGKTPEASMIKALVNLSTSEFADSDALLRVAEMMRQVQTNLTNAIQTFTEEDAAAQAAFEAEVDQKQKEITEMEAEVVRKNDELDTTNRQIAEAEAFVATRKLDLAGFQKELDEENASYEKDTEVYNDLVAEFNKELDALEQALEVLNGAEFAGYLSDRMSMDVVIDTPHDTGVQV